MNHPVLEVHNYISPYLCQIFLQSNINRGAKPNCIERLLKRGHGISGARACMEPIKLNWMCELELLCICYICKHFHFFFILVGFVLGESSLPEKKRVKFGTNDPNL